MHHDELLGAENLRNRIRLPFDVGMLHLQIGGLLITYFFLMVQTLPSNPTYDSVSANLSTVWSNDTGMPWSKWHCS